MQCTTFIFFCETVVFILQDLAMTTEQRASPREILTQLYEAAAQRALPLHNTAAYLPKPPKGRTIVIGAGKAGWAMEQAKYLKANKHAFQDGQSPPFESFCSAYRVAGQWIMAGQAMNNIVFSMPTWCPSTLQSMCFNHSCLNCL